VESSVVVSLGRVLIWNDGATSLEKFRRGGLKPRPVRLKYMSCSLRSDSSSFAMGKALLHAHPSIGCLKDFEVAF